MKQFFVRTWYDFGLKQYLPMKYKASIMLLFSYGFCCIVLHPFAIQSKKLIFFFQKKRKKDSRIFNGADILSSFLEKILLKAQALGSLHLNNGQNFFQNP